MAVYISNCGSDESGKYTGGAAGDQTGKEWCVKALSGSWTYVLRHPDSDTRAMLAKLAKQAAENDCIGYDQSQRTTFYTQLKAAGWYPSKITAKCEADCSAGVAAIVIAAGNLLGDSKMKAVSKDVYTGNERAALKSAGFESLAYSSGMALYAGDVLLRSTHTAIVTQGNATATSSTSKSTSTSTTSTTSTKLTVDGAWGKNTTKAVQKLLGTTQDGVVSYQLTSLRKYLSAADTESWKFYASKKGGSAMVKALQKRCGATADGYAGQATVKAMQKRLNSRAGAGLTVDGYMGAKTVKALQTALNNGKF